eukprot:1332394-Prymnesium_polylepis.1
MGRGGRHVAGQGAGSIEALVRGGGCRRRAVRPTALLALDLLSPRPLPWPSPLCSLVRLTCEHGATDP